MPLKNSIFNTVFILLRLAANIHKDLRLNFLVWVLDSFKKKDKINKIILKPKMKIAVLINEFKEIK